MNQKDRGASFLYVFPNGRSVDLHKNSEIFTPDEESKRTSDVNKNSAKCAVVGYGYL